MTRFIAVDPGFGVFKVTEVVGDAVFTNQIPAVVGIGPIKNMGMLSMGVRRSRVTQQKPLQIEIDGQSYLVGKNVHRHTRPSTRLDYGRLSDGPELKALILSSLALRMNGGPFDCSLIIGFPVEVAMDEELGPKTLASLRGWLVGEHKFTLNGEKHRITVQKIKAMGQPVGSYWAFGLDNRGQWTRDKQDYNVPVAVLDIGYNTLDMFAIEKGVINHRTTGGDNLGMHRAGRAIHQGVKSDFGVKLSLHEADELIKTGSTHLHHLGGTADISNLIEAALSATFADVSEFIKDHIDDQPFRYLILTGGGAKALKSWLVNEFPHAIIPPDPVTANSIGLAKFAQSKRAGL